MTTQSPIASFRQVLSAVSADIRLLGLQTLLLARLELSAALSVLAYSGMGVLASVLIAAAGAAVLVAALVLIVIALGLPPWAASTLVGVLLIVGGALSARYFVGRIRQVDLGLMATRKSLLETLEWLKAETGN
jgi:hypothetical protein